MNTVSKTPTPIQYRIEPFDPAGHRFRVHLKVEQPDAGGQCFALPAWIPGSYLIRDFARQIETISARCHGAAVALRKLDDHRWQADAAEGPLELEYTVYAWDLSVRGAHLDESHGFFNGTSVFLQVVGQEDRPCLVDIAAPAGINGWKVHTSLPEARGLPGCARRHGFGCYLAPDYDALIDHPVEMGTPLVARFDAHGAEHEIVFTGLVPQLDLSRIIDDVRRICETQIAFFEPDTRRAPFLDSARRYVFLVQVTGDGYGGLEHRASTALLVSRNDLPVLGETEQSDGYRSFLGLVSHEYFHTWHVKRIKPAAFVPYVLDRPAHTRLLWVFEGFTSYYDDLMLLRAGVISETNYFKLLGKTLHVVHNGTGRFKQSVAQSSFDAWTRYYKQDENSVNAISSYYTKGSLVALALDLHLRNASGGKKSLDDVMRLLWKRYGREFYRGLARGIPEDAMPALVQEATGIDATAEIAAWTEGTEDLPLPQLFAAQGFQAGPAAAGSAPSLDIRTRASSDGAGIAAVQEGGAAHHGGLSAQDLIIAADGLRIASVDALNAMLARRRAGDVVRFHVFRRDELRQFTVTLNPAQPGNWTISKLAGPAA